MDMIQIDLNIPLLSLDGTKVMPEEILGKVLGAQLVGQSKGDILKYYDWATELYKGKAITVDKSDFNKIKTFIENSETLFIIAKAQMLRKLEECEKESLETKKD